MDIVSRVAYGHASAPGVRRHGLRSKKRQVVDADWLRVKQHVIDSWAIFRCGAHRETSLDLPSVLIHTLLLILYNHRFYRQSWEVSPPVPILIRCGACVPRHKAVAEYCKMMPNNPRKRKASLLSPPLSGPSPQVWSQCSRTCLLPPSFKQSRLEPCCIASS